MTPRSYQKPTQPLNTRLLRQFFLINKVGEFFINDNWVGMIFILMILQILSMYVKKTSLMKAINHIAKKNELQKVQLHKARFNHLLYSCTNEWYKSNLDIPYSVLSRYGKQFYQRKYQYYFTNHVTCLVYKNKDLSYLFPRKNMFCSLRKVCV